MQVIKPLLSEQLRPTRIADLTLPEDVVHSFERMVANGAPMNMIFYGKPGIGKTSAANILLKELAADVFEVNGSFDNVGTDILHHVETFSRHFSLFGSLKVVFIDEADYLNKKAQASLRKIIENASHLTRFILTGNYFDRFTDAITSRCTPICFDVPLSDTNPVIDRMVLRYSARLTELGYIADEKTIRHIVSLYFPDLRSIANRFQLELEVKPVD